METNRIVPARQSENKAVRFFATCIINGKESQEQRIDEEQPLNPQSELGFSGAVVQRTFSSTVNDVNM
jgi:hypothetical protein